jgi:cell division protein FtsZ
MVTKKKTTKKTTKKSVKKPIEKAVKTTKKTITKKKVTKKPVKKTVKKVAKKVTKPVTKKAVKKVSKPATPKDPTLRRTKVRVIGLGGGGSSIVSEISGGLKKASFVIANTDKQALKKGKNVISFSFGEDLTGGLGTGMNPELGREAALVAKDKIDKLLDGQDLCVFVSCLGGGTGSGSIPVFAKAAKDQGNLTYGIFTLPFRFEGEKKMEMALEAIDNARRYFDALTIIPNEKVFNVVDKNTPLGDVFSTVNKNLIEGLEGLIDMIYEPGVINIDFADLRRVLENQGKLAYINNVEISRDKFSVEDLVKKVVSNPLYSYSVGGAKGILLNISGEKDLSLMEVDKISRGISELVNKEARIIFGISQKPSLKNKIKVALLATGCSFRISSPKKKMKAKPKKKVVKKEEPKEEIVEEKKEMPKPKKKVVKKKPVVKKEEPKKEVVEPVKEVVVEKPEVIEEPQKEVVKKNGLQLREELDDFEAKILAQEEEFDIPAFMRKGK